MFLFDYDKPVEAITEPFCSRYYDGALDQNWYDELVETFPTEGYRDLNVGYQRKWSFGQREDGFFEFLDRNLAWRMFYEFIDANLKTICETALDFEIKKPRTEMRFEFSDLPAEGGCVLPHPDTRKKVATCIVYMEPDWNPEWGGAFEALRHKTDPYGDFTNGRPEWDEVETALEIPVKPNRVLFLKRAGNSLHGVRTLHSPRPRRSVTLTVIGR